MRGAASLRLFRLSNFRALWIGQLVSIFGDRFTYLALLALVVERASDPSNPARELAWIPLVSFLPAILFAPWIGALVDGWNVRTTLILSDAARGVIVLAIPPAVSWGGLPAAMGLVFLLYVANAFFLPARSAILPELVPTERLTEANSLATLAGVLATIAGSFAAGWLIDRAGWRVGFVLDAATYFVSVVALLFLRVPATPRAAGGRTTGEAYRALFRDVLEGGRLVLASRRVLGVILALMLLWVAGGALHVSIPTVLERRGSAMVSGVGAALGFAASGMVLGTLLLAARGGGGPSMIRLVASLAGAGLGAAGFALIPGASAPAVTAFLTGVFVAALLVTTESILQEEVRAGARARVFALRDFLARLGVLASAGLFGWLLERRRLTPDDAVLAAGVLLMLGAVGFAWFQAGGRRDAAGSGAARAADPTERARERD